MKQRIINVYSYSELSEDAKQKALAWMENCNQPDEWWECTYDDATAIGLKIKSFDCGRANDIDGELTKNLLTCAELIIKHHGENCDTYAIASKYQLMFHEYMQLVLDDDYSDKQIEFESDNEENFTKELLECYLSMLKKELEYISSREYLEECIEANSYEFLESGQPA